MLHVFQKPCIIDHSGIYLRAALVKMIAMVVGLPPKKSHLWFHLFMPEELEQSYVSGFMVQLHFVSYCCDFISNNISIQCKPPVGPSTYFLDTGLEVTQEGFIKHQDHIVTSHHGGLTVHSHHLLLLLNLGALCVHMIFKMRADEKLMGRLVSEKANAGNDCFFQLRRLWDCFGNCLSLSLEECSVLVERTLIQHYKVCA